MLPIGDERDAVDALANRNFILRQQLVSGNANQGRRHTEIELGGHTATGQFLNRFHRTGYRAGDNHQHNEDACQVFRAIVAVGVAAIGRTVGDDERDPQRDRGEYITQVVQGIGKEARAPSKQGDGELDD